MQLKEIFDSITDIGSFLASVGVIVYVIKRVGEFLTWGVFFALVSMLGVIYIHNQYVESPIVRLIASGLLILCIGSIGFVASEPHTPKK